jgi:hypothetical protein
VGEEGDPDEGEEGGGDGPGLGEGPEGERPAGETAEEDPLVRQRDEFLGPVQATLARRVKRALQDDQNRLLDRGRSAPGGWSEAHLGSEDDARAALAEAATDPLTEAGTQGVAFAAAHGRSGGAADPERAADSARRLAASVVSQLRRRLTGEEGVPAGASGDEAADRIGAAYREWRGERVERLVGDHAVEVFSAGVLSAGEGPVRWVTAGGPAACADCDDNALGGAVAAGEEFPTGHRNPPAHTGCRCAVVPTAD